MLEAALLVDELLLPIDNGLSNCSTLLTSSSTIEFLLWELILDLKLAAEGTVLGDDDNGDGGLDTALSSVEIGKFFSIEVLLFVQSSTCRAVK